MFGYLLCCIYCFESLVIAKVILLLFSLLIFIELPQKPTKYTEKNNNDNVQKKKGYGRGK